MPIYFWVIHVGGKIISAKLDLISNQSIFVNAKHILDLPKARMNINKNTISIKTNQGGYTLVEIIAVLIILAILASLSIPKFVDLGANANKTALRSAVNELNGREQLVWTQIKTSQIGWTDDETIFSQIDSDLGADYKWSPKANIDGGILHFKDQMIKLQRTPSTETSAGRWKIIFSST